MLIRDDHEVGGVVGVEVEDHKIASGAQDDEALAVMRLRELDAATEDAGRGIGCRVLGVGCGFRVPIGHAVIYPSSFLTAIARAADVGHAPGGPHVLHDVSFGSPGGAKDSSPRLAPWGKLILQRSPGG